MPPAPRVAAPAPPPAPEPAPPAPPPEPEPAPLPPVAAEPPTLLSPPLAPEPAPPAPAPPPALVLEPEPPPAAAPAPAPPVTPPPGDPATDDGTVACVLPGVVVGPTLARGISGAASRARLRRRRRRRAGPPAAGLHRRDPFGSELTQRLEWFALSTRQGPNGASRTTADPGRVPAGERDGVEVSVPFDQVGGITILGPGSSEAARALVLTFLAEHGQHRGRVIVVGDLFPSTSTFPGLGRAREVSSVMSGLQSEAARRRSLFADAGVTDIGAYRANRPAEPMPTVLVAASNLPPTDAGRLGEVLGGGAALGLVGVLADTPLDGLATLRLQGHREVASAQPQEPMAGLVGARLFGVEREPAGELLEVLASARVDPDNEPTVQPGGDPFQGVPAGPALISVNLLGAYRIEAGGREVRAGLRAKARELLAFYLLHPEGTSLEEATAALWPEADPRRGSEWFWTALGNLRSRLRAATESSDLKVIEREGDRYRIEALFDVDLWRFEHALAEASGRSGEPALSDALEAAADLYRGELLAGMDWPWAEIPREDLRGRAVDVLASLAATHMVSGDHAGALRALEQAVEIDPRSEQLYRRMMRLHAKLSSIDQADATYRLLQARLGEHDLEPSPETAKLHQELLG